MDADKRYQDYKDLCTENNFKIIGFDGASITKEFLPNSTTIEQPISLLAKISVRHPLFCYK